jgi:hypothetical protein
MNNDYDNIRDENGKNAIETMRGVVRDIPKKMGSKISFLGGYATGMGVALNNPELVPAFQDACERLSKEVSLKK